MNNEDSVENKIMTWLFDEELAVTKKDDDKSEFHIVISNAYGLGFFIDIVKPKNKPVLLIAMTIGNTPEFIQSFLTIKEKERIRIIGGIQRELLKFGVEHNVQPNASRPERISITDILYPEDITRTSFMGSIRRVKLASLYTIWSLNQKFMPDKEPTP